jgi:ABC-2 type transport system ATP-binding protein
MMKTVVETKRLRKVFGKTTAVDGVSFKLRLGEIVGLLGPNGAGKTTTINMLLGLTKPDAGEIKIFGLDLARERQVILQRVGYASAELRMQDRLSVYHNLYIFAMLFQLKNRRERIHEVLGELELLSLKDKAFAQLSSGQKTKVILAKAFLNQPELLLLDEPTASLDPEISRKVEDYLLMLRGARKTTMLYTSHDMAEVTRLCDRIIFLHRGRIIADDTPVNLTKQLKDTLMELVFSSALAEVKSYCRRQGWRYQIPEPNRLLVWTAEEKVAGVLTGLSEAGIEIVDIQIKRPDLTDVFIALAREGGMPKPGRGVESGE